MARYSMPGFLLGLAGHVTMTKSHGFLVYIDIHGLLSATRVSLGTAGSHE